MPTTLSSIPGAIEYRSGLPRPNWGAVWEWVEKQKTESEYQEVWSSFARDWLTYLAEALGIGYTVSESVGFLLLANCDRKRTERILGHCEHSRHTILNTLEGAAKDEGYGKHVVLAFGSQEHYYDYICDFYPDEGEFAPSMGMFIKHGYGHFAMSGTCGEHFSRTIAHELNHALLGHLPIPLWLNEGITQVVEDLVVEGSYFTATHEMALRHRAYWNADTIHSFWSGESFYSPDDGQELSYHLAQVLVRNLVTDFPKEKIVQLLNTANFRDAGNSAMLETYGVTVAERVLQFLGDGPWNPTGDYWSDDYSDQ